MTVKDIYLKALVLLGYVNTNGDISGQQELQKQCVAAVNQIYAEVFFAIGRKEFEPINSSDDEIDLPERILHDIMPYGVAMFIAQSENDGDSQQLYANIYNKKRASVRAINCVQDVMPRGSDF